MQTHSADILEYKRCLELIADYAGSKPGQDHIRDLTPGSDSDAHDICRRRVEAMIKLRQEERSLPVAHFEIPDDILRQAAPEASVLDADAFHSLSELLTAGQRIRRFLTEDGDSSPALLALGQGIPPLRELHEQLDQVFDDDGGIRDRASSALSAVRKEIAQLERRIRRQLDKILHAADLSEVVQEEHLAIRNQRYVVPVRREQKSRFPGVVHDQSNSGRTLFMEPAATIENGNNLAAARLEERDEIRRILRNLTDLVRHHHDDLQQVAAALTDYDFAFAVSHWAVEFECRYVARSGRLRLTAARHPLLLSQFRQEGREEELVPLDFHLPPDTRVLVITGANAGGKTVVLKTVGLLVLLSQTGLPVPAGEKSCIPGYETVEADIGDEQSLRQNLSTFSSHLTHIRDILGIAQEQRTLVLLDELGAGTDPVEGAALSCAVLQNLCEYRGLTLATTHLAVIKQYVHEHPAMTNASVTFNEQTLTPEFVLQVGRPGASHAMTIARNIGLPGFVLDQAATLLDSEQLHLETLLAQMDQDQRQLQEDVAAAKTVRERLERESNELRNELQNQRRDRKKRLRQAQQKAAAIVEDTRREMKSILREAKPGKTSEETEALRHRVQQKKKSLNQALAETRPKPKKRLNRDQLSVGDQVWVQVLDEHGTIQQISDDGARVKVEVGGISFDVNAAELGPPTGKSAPGIEPKVSVRKPTGSKPMGRELNLIGKRVEPALGELAHFLDRAALSNVSELRIIHGYGTGALRQAVHEYLSESPLVKEFRLGNEGKDAGGGGVTWAKL